MPVLLSESAYRHLSTFSLYLLYCTAFFYFNNFSLGEATYKLFLLSSLSSMLLARQGSWRITALFAVSASILIQLASWLYSRAHHPEYADPDFKRMTSLLLFVLVAWTLYINKRQPWFLFLVFFVGTSFTPFTKGEGIEEFLGVRSNFGILNAQHPAMMFSIAFVGFVVFAKRIFIMSPLHRNTTAVLYVLALLYCLAILFVANTRGVFLGLALACLPISYINLRHRFHIKNSSGWLAGVAAIIACTVFVMNSEHLTSRWMAESSDFRGIAEGDLKAISGRTNVGIRIHSWVAAYRGFLDSPILGLGANGQKLVLAQSDTLPQDIKAQFGHLHNAYLEVLTNNGLLGLAFLIFIYWWLRRTIFSTKPTVDSDIRVFAISSGVLWLVANCFESYMFYKSGIMTFAIVAGGLMSLGLISSEHAESGE